MGWFLRCQRSLKLIWEYAKEDCKKFDVMQTVMYIAMVVCVQIC